MTAAPTTPLVVAARRVVADGVVALDLRAPDGGTLPGWEPGAHVDVVLGDGLVRQYSLCGDPDDATVYRIGVLLEPLSRGGSRAVHALAEGDTVRVGLPRNRFPLLDAPAYLFLAGGIGVTPLLPMARRVAGSGRPWRFVHGGRTAASMAFTDELPAGAVLHPQHTHGLLPLEAELTWAVEHEASVWCCGPDPLLDAVARLAAATVGPDRLHVERFRAAEPAGGGADDAPFDVVVASHDVTVTVPPGRSVLDVLEGAGLPVLSSCREGTCGTCELAVLEGEVDHRDGLLTPAERDAHDTMFPCVSRSRTPRIVVEL